VTSKAVTNRYIASLRVQYLAVRVSNPGTIFQSRDFGIGKRQFRDPGILGLIPGMGVSRKTANLLAHTFLQAVFLSVRSDPCSCGQLWFDYWIDRLWSRVSLSIR